MSWPENNSGTPGTQDCNHRYNLTWPAARALALSGAYVRRWGWTDRWLLRSAALWWITPLVADDDAFPVRVVEAADFGRVEFLAADWTTMWPDQAECVVDPPPPPPDVWTNCVIVSGGSNNTTDPDAEAQIPGGYPLLPISIPPVTSAPLQIVVPIQYGDALVSGALAAVGNVGLTINGRVMPRASEVANTSILTGDQIFRNVDQIVFVLTGLSATRHNFDFEFKICTAALPPPPPPPPPDDPDPAGGVVRQHYEFFARPASFPGFGAPGGSGGGWLGLVHGIRSIPNPLSVTASVRITGKSDGGFVLNNHTVAMPPDAYAPVPLNLSFILAAGASFTIGSRLSGNGDTGYNIDVEFRA